MYLEDNCVCILVLSLTYVTYDKFATILNLNFLIYKMGILIVPAL